MPVFKKTKEKTEDSNLTKQTLLFGGGTFLIFLVIFVFGLPLLIRFSVYLADRKKDAKTSKSFVLPPQPPRVIMPFEATPSATIDLRGYAEKNTSVELTMPDGNKIRKNVNEEGEFIFEKLSLQSGPNMFSAIALFSEDLKSEPMKSITVIQDQTPPDLTLTNPSEDKITVDVPDFDIVGKTEQRCIVNINSYTASVNDNGDFKLKMLLQPGKNEYTVTSRDPAGNETRKKVVITYDF